MDDATAPPDRRQDNPLGEEDTPSAGDLKDGGGLAGSPPPASDLRRSPDMAWSPWTAPAALIGGLVLAAVLGLIVDLPATLLLGVSITRSHTPPGIELADTIVQDAAFVLAAVYCANIGGTVVRAWQFGLRPPGVGWKSAIGYIALLTVLFLILSAIWAAVFNPEPEKLLEQLGANEATSLLLLSAALTCVVAPICEELLFRGYVFTALRGWRGTWPAAVITGAVFGLVHLGSAPALDLVPLAVLGFGLCLLYRYTGSLYPCIVAHSLNNSLAFASLEGWGWQAPLLMIAALASIAALVLAAKRIGLITPEASAVAAGA
ncbi:MAG TPA: type II CAAX endopeptidase family protein [Solirubrobacteraceae bacterium]|jgi:membrane protease YdiL (CAAX protease family)|nr:type II CAAX endopeptidase family protein [Solirubrobacteraceae bacterium]